LEIPRRVPPPPLTAEEIRTITDTVFVLPAPIPSGTLLLFGSNGHEYDKVVHTFNAGLCERILVSGAPHARQAREELLARGVPDRSILVETNARHTLEEVRFALAILEDAGARTDRLIYACLRAHSGRCYRTIKRFLPDASLSCLPFAHKVTNTHETNWHLHEESRAAVYAEYLRIRLYAERGDIATL
jgi:uncharacterized SAM-binding protein YcdF (DUF218 family)